jgi:N-acetylmuramoyl-L-alanine amidase
MDLFNYLLRASVCMALCYILYPFVFKRLTFFSMNRFYLLFIVTASLVIPALHIKIREPFPVNATSPAVILSGNVFAEKEQLLPVGKPTANINWVLIASLVYSAVCIAMLIKTGYSALKIVIDAKRHGVKTDGNYIVMNHHKRNASFFHFIFISFGNTQSVEMDQVLAHEKTHARLYHSADNLYMEMAKAFFWFNPFIYVIANALYEVHEFEVDRSLKNIFDTKQYASLLLRLSSPSAPGLINKFSAHSLKSRIGMLFKPHSPAFKKLWYLAIIPVLAIAGYWFSVEKVYGKASLKKDFVLILDAGHGGSQYGAVGAGGYYEKDLTLQVVNEIKSVAEKRGVQTILTRSDDSYLDLRGRVGNKGDAFISIHVNAPGKWTKYTNGMEIIVERNALYPFTEKLAGRVKTALQQLKGINEKHGIDISETSPNNTLYILRHNKAPALLLELGYMTDPDDLNYIINANNQHKIAEKIVDAVVAYGGNK